MLMDTSELLAACGVDPTEPDQDIIQRFRHDDAMEIPIELTDVDMWANYTNENLYVMDKKIREFLKKTRWKRQTKNGYKTTASMVFAWIYGRQPTPADGAACRVINEILKYYCTTYTGRTTYRGKAVPRVYKFSKYATTNKRPYSLRLRMEEAHEGQSVFREGPGHKGDKRQHRRKDGPDGQQEAV